MKIKYHKILLYVFCIIAISNYVFGQSEIGKVPYEDLNDCELQNGIQELPKEGSPKARELNGQIFNFKTQKLSFDPLTKQNKFPNSYKEFRDSVIKAKTGDIYFESVEIYYLIALSGRIKNLGKHYLYEFNNVKMSVPEEVFYTEEGEKAPGVLTNVKLGECFLMTTLEQELVLLRLISIDIDKRCCTIQCVKAKSGSNTFEIPKGQLIQPESEKGSANKIAIQQNTVYQKELALQIEYLQENSKAIDTHLTNREKVIKYCMNKLSSPVDVNSLTSEQILMIRGEQRQALLTIGKMRAIEPATLLADMIDYHISGDESSVVYEVTVNNTFGCVPVLVKIGKPGAAACLKEIVNLSQVDWEKPFKAKLLLLVILRVEGEKYTRQILNDFKESLSDEIQVKNIEKAIALIDEAISYDGPKEDIYSQLKQELIKESGKN